MDLSVLVLGRLEVRRAGEVVHVGGPKQRTALALIIDGKGQRVSVDRLVQAAHGDDAPQRAKRSIHTFVANLRREFGDAISGDGSGYKFDPGRVDVDADSFSSQVARGLADLPMDPTAASLTLGRALELWRGDRAYADIDAFGALTASRTRLLELRIRAQTARIEADLRLGRHEDLIPELREQVERHPLVEAFHRHLMLALYRAGRQTEAVRAFDHATATLIDEAGLDPSPELAALCDRILRQDSSLELSTPPQGLLPSRTTSFIGRDDDLDAVVELVRSQRLVTLVGPGGVGKTSLATEAVRSIAADHEGPVAFAQLSSADSALAVETAVGRALGVDERTGTDLRSIIQRTVASSRTLLILDTCEHIVDAVASLVAELLRQCPNLRILATSRRSLRTDGEVRFTLRPLPTSQADGPSEAAQLLADRFRLVAPQLVITPANEEAIELIARRLDGLPLAIEIVAARAKWFGLDTVASQLTDRGGIMLDEPRRGGDDRHTSLARAIEWSVDLLSDDAKAAFAGLGVFRAGFSPESARRVIDALELPADSDDLLVELLEASLVNRHPGDPVRYSMLDTIGAASVRRLETGELRESARRAHAEDTLARLTRRENLVAANRILPDLESDSRSSVAWAITADPGLAVAIAGAAAKWYWLFGSRVSGYAFLEPVVEQCAIPHDRSGQTVAEWLAMFAAYFGDGSLATKWLEFAIETSRAIGEPSARTSALRVAAFHAASRNDVAAAIRFNEEALEIDSAAEDLLGVARDLRNLANWSYHQGNAERLEELAAQNDALAGPFGHTKGMLLGDRWRADAAVHRGDLEDALRWLVPVVDTLPQESTDSATTLMMRADVHLWRGDTKSARQDLDTLAETDHLTSAPWAMEMRQYAAGVQAALQRSAGDLDEAAETLCTALRESLRFINVLELRIVTLPRLLIEAVAVLSARHRFAPAATLAAFSRQFSSDTGRKAPAPLERVLGEAEGLARTRLDAESSSSALADAASLDIETAVRFAVAQLMGDISASSV